MCGDRAPRSNPRRNLLTSKNHYTQGNKSSTQRATGKRRHRHLSQHKTAATTKGALQGLLAQYRSIEFHLQDGLGERGELQNKSPRMCVCKRSKQSCGDDESSVDGWAAPPTGGLLQAAELELPLPLLLLAAAPSRGSTVAGQLLPWDCGPPPGECTHTTTRHWRHLWADNTGLRGGRHTAAHTKSASATRQACIPHKRPSFI